MSNERYGARVEFTSGLSDRLAQVRCALEQLRQRPHDGGLFAETRSSLHELAATAGSFGLDELTEIALRVEQALLAWHARGSLPTAWAAAADAAAAPADFEDRLTPETPAAPWRVVRAGL